MSIQWIIAAIFGNLGYVGGGIWRSAQRWYLYPVWACLGLKTIINLATSVKDSQDNFEFRFCKWLNIKYVAFDNLAPDYNFEAALKSLTTCERPVLVHCEGGKDRTGGLIAYYKKTVLQTTWTDIIKDWSWHMIPGENWLTFLFKY